MSKKNISLKSHQKMKFCREGGKKTNNNSSQSSHCVFFLSVLLYLHVKILFGLLRLLLRSSSRELPNAEILRATKSRLAAFAAIFAFQTERAHMLPGHQKPQMIFFCPEMFSKFREIFLFGCFGEVVVVHFLFEW